MITSTHTAAFLVNQHSSFEDLARLRLIGNLRWRVTWPIKVVITANTIFVGSRSEISSIMY